MLAIEDENIEIPTNFSLLILLLSIDFIYSGRAESE
jgi:hypothetical protein